MSGVVQAPQGPKLNCKNWQIECAAFLRRLIKGSQFLREDDPNNVQDPYTLRCVPQVHGAVRDAVAYAEWVINIELNAAIDKYSYIYRCEK